MTFAFNAISLVRISALSFVCVMCPVVCCVAQQDERVPEKEKSPSQEISVSIEKQVAEALYKSHKDESPLIRTEAYSMLASSKQLFVLLDQTKQLEIIEAGFKDPKISQTALLLLNKSKLGQLKKNKLMLDVCSDQDSGLQEMILQEFSQNPESVVLQIISMIRDDIEGDHRRIIGVLELMGPDSAKAVPTLRAHFDARTANEKNEEAAAFDYLHLVYAVAEIATTSNDAMPIVLAAVEEQGDARIEYRIAGLIAMKKLLAISKDALDVNPADAILAAAPPATRAKLRQYADSLFKTYDQNKNGQLDPAETKNMRRKPTSADFDHDGVISKNELIASLVGGSTAQKRTVKTRSIRDQVKKSIKNSR